MARRDTRVKSAVKAIRNPPIAAPEVRPEPKADLAGDETFAKLGEFLRRAALGLTAMLFVVRAYFPSEDADTGSGLVWVFAMLATSAIAVASFLLAGKFRVRWSWADAAVLSLMVLVAMSASHAADRRPAITMAWEWGSLGLLYFLFRNLPRSRGESAVLAGVMVATAVAVAAYGLYQIPVEFAQLRNLFQRRPEAVLIRMGVEPGSPSALALEKRLYSNEPFSTFALANSLAGFLVGPMALAFAVALENLKREGRGSRLVALAMASIPGLILLVCLVLTKSRSAYVGLFAALLVLAWRARRGLPPKVLAFTGASLAVLVGALVVAGVATKQLDIQVITESTKSLRYRWEYWVGAWGVITDAPSPYASTGEAALPGGGEVAAQSQPSGTFWSGVGPANFAMPYLSHKLPQASEEIQDPHNMVLEVWAESGVFAMLALLAALAIGLREMLGPSREVAPSDELDPAAPPAKPGRGSRSGAAWLVLMAGLGWIAVWALGKLNPIAERDLLPRWLILGAAWALTIALGAPLWKRRPIPAAGLGVALLALSINLLAAGGIGMPSVAMSLWALLAIGLNLREDRPCGRIREAGGLGPSMVLACVWAALAGTFFGAVMPFWQSESYRAAGDAAMATRPPSYEVAREAYKEAIAVDHYNVRPWISLADLEYAYWRSPEQVKRKEPQYMKPLIALDGALDPKWRNPNSLALRRRQADYARAILRDLPKDAGAWEVLQLQSTIVRACRWKTRIYPTSATLRAELAQASAEIGMYPDAVKEGKQALKLDELTPHLDKKLPPALRAALIAQIPKWEEKVKEGPPKPPAPPGSKRQ